MRAVPSKRPKARTAERVRTEYIPLLGGEDQVSPALSIKPGALTFSENYEPGIVFGYRRIDGFERSDGQPKPSAASYWIIDFTTGTTEPPAGSRFFGGTSLAEADVLSVTLSSGSWGGGDAAGYIVLTNVSGTFINGETLSYSVPLAFSSGFTGGFA
jgi:hypothetical protein